MRPPYKPTYKNKRGKSTKVKKWWIEVVDRREKRFRKVLRFSAFEGEGLSKTIGTKVQKLIDNDALNEKDPDLIRWFSDYAPRKLQDKLGDIGLLPKRVIETEKPLIDYLPDFQKDIFEQSKRDKKKKTTTGDTSARTAKARVRKILEGRGFTTWADVTSDAVNEYIESRPDEMSQQTAHFYVQTFRRFNRWMLKQGHVNQLLEINGVGVAKNYRRCFELKEFKALLKATKSGPERYDMTGTQRYVLYLLAVETGLRRGELRSLTVGSIDIKNGCVSVQGGPAGATKNKAQAVQFLTPETLQILKQYTRGKLPNVQLFDIPDKSAKMLRADCKAAKINTDNHKGKIQFHCLRNTCGSYLAANGVQANTIKDIMRHQDIRLTMDRYVRELDGAAKKAVNMMPRFTKEKSA